MMLINFCMLVFPWSEKSLTAQFFISTNLKKINKELNNIYRECLNHIILILEKIFEFNLVICHKYESMIM